jgi:hypothetical protein
MDRCIRKASDMVEILGPLLTTFAESTISHAREFTHTTTTSANVKCHDSENIANFKCSNSL